MHKTPHDQITGPSLSTHATCLVITVGSTLVADDQVGPMVFDLLQKKLPSHVRLHQAGLAGLNFLDYFNAEELLIIVDAVYLGAKPGTVHLFENEEIPRSSRPTVSSHGIGLLEALDVCRIITPERMPQRVVLIGVEGRDFSSLGLKPTHEVQEGIRLATQKVIDLIYNRPPETD